MKMRPDSSIHPDREPDYGTHPDRRDLMIPELRAEAARMREFALTVTDPEVLAEIQAMADEDEWERRARGQGNGGSSD
jgi:hypothetical protein